MERLVRPAIDSILEVIAELETAMAGVTVEVFAQNWILLHAAQRGVEIISEASRRIPSRLRDQRPEVQWREILGIGNVLRHEYDSIMVEVIYSVVTKDIVSLKAAIFAIEANLDEPEE